ILIAAAALPQIPFEKYQLPNGLTVILSEDHRAPLVAVDIWYHVGAVNERKGRSGFAHLFEHLMFQGSKHLNGDERTVFALLELLYPDPHPYFGYVIGSHEDLEKASLEDVRGFFHTYYSPNNAALAIVGDFRPVDVKPLVEKYFGPIPRGPEPAPVTAKTEPHTKQIRETMRDQVQLAKVLVGFVGPKPLEHPATALLMRILAGGKSSRLYHDLVYEKKIAQDVSATWDPSMQLGGVIEITATVQAGHAPEEVVAALSDEVKRLRA